MRQLNLAASIVAVALATVACGTDTAAPVTHYSASENVGDIEGQHMFTLSAEFPRSKTPNDAADWLDSLELVPLDILTEDALLDMPDAAFPTHVDIEAHDRDVDLSDYVLIDPAESGLRCVDEVIELSELTREIEVEVAALSSRPEVDKGHGPVLAEPISLRVAGGTPNRLWTIAVTHDGHRAYEGCTLDVEIEEWNGTQSHRIELPAFGLDEQVEVGVPYQYRKSCRRDRNIVSAKVRCDGSTTDSYQNRL
ncbi:MAG: flagellar basal body L-ring protein FlgH [Planctomycetota bacterium]|jgi:hypothetical protein